MKLVFGGCYQGKLEFAMLNFGHTEQQVLSCDDNTLSLEGCHKIVYGFEKFVLNCIVKDINPIEYMDSHLEQLNDKVIICNDISSGIVPVDQEKRRWREVNGKCLQFIAEHSTCVYRVFCGLPMLIKNEQ